jgi:futalosine hydrolase
MKILLVSATQHEIAPFLQAAGAAATEGIVSKAWYNTHEVDLLLTGVGIAQTSYYMGKFLTAKYDLAINAGICGSFNPHLHPGDVVNITEDYFADLGAEDDEKFLSVSELGLPGAYYVRNEHLFPTGFRQVRGVTVNTTHGNERSIQKFTTRLKADVESMEGAAFLWACNKERVKCIQLRSISNYVEKRDRSKWKISEAIESLDKSLVELLLAL